MVSFFTPTRQLHQGPDGPESGAIAGGIPIAGEFMIVDMGDPYRGDTQKWMVYFMENPFKMHDNWGTPILGNLHTVESPLWT